MISSPEPVVCILRSPVLLSIIESVPSCFISKSPLLPNLASTLSPNLKKLLPLLKRILFELLVSKVTLSPRVVVEFISTALLNVYRPTTFNPLLSVMSVLTPVLELIVNISVC